VRQNLDPYLDVAEWFRISVDLCYVKVRKDVYEVKGG
jgi:hypothetical protein